MSTVIVSEKRYEVTVVKEVAVIHAGLGLAVEITVKVTGEGRGGVHVITLTSSPELEWLLKLDGIVEDPSKSDVAIFVKDG